MKTRTKNALLGTNYAPDTAPALVALVEFAAQNPGLDFANYGERSAYQQEARAIQKDWQRFKDALRECSDDGVTDAEILAAAPRAFSGRLSFVASCSLWPTGNLSRVVGFEQTPADCPAYPGYRLKQEKAPEWTAVMAADKLAFAVSYCTGQYFPTEYRKAAASVLEAASAAVRRNRAPVRQLPRSMAELKALNKLNGGHWFEASSMRFFGTRIESGIISGRYFITSEQPPHGPRKFSVRVFNSQGDVDTVGEFAEASTIQDAREFLRVALRQIQHANALAKIAEREDGRWIVLDQPKDSPLWSQTFGNEYDVAGAVIKGTVKPASV